MPRKVLAKKSTFAVNFKDPFSFSGTPYQDSRLPDFTINDGNRTSKGYDVRSVGFDIMGSSGENLTLSYDGGKRTANMTKKTLEKGAGTLMGMAPKFGIRQTQAIGVDGKKGEITNTRYQVQGFNYANPNYVNAVAFAKTSQTAGVRVDKKTQFENAQKNIQNILDTRVTIASLPDALKGGSVVEELQQQASSGSSSRPDGLTYNAQDTDVSGGVKKRNAQRRAQNYLNAVARSKTNPTLIHANEIQSKLGRSQIGIYKRPVGYGNRYESVLSGNPSEVITDYYNKTALIDWAKSTNPDAQLDPKKTVSIIDKTTTHSYFSKGWCHNNRCRGGGWRSYQSHTYKDVLVSSPESGKTAGDKMDMFYNQIVDKSSEKKKKYETYFNTDPTIGDHNYYSITDSEFDEMDKYKGNLVTNIRDTKSARYGIKEKLSTSFSLDATTPLDDNAPKQKYLEYQKTGQDSFITPTVAGLSSKLISSDESEKQNLTNAIKFVEGKSKELSISGNIVASRDNLGRVTISDKTSYEKYIKDTPSEYLKQPDKLDTTIIPELEKEDTEQASKYSEMELEYYRKERAKAQFAGVTKPKRNYTRNAKRRR